MKSVLVTPQKLNIKRVTASSNHPGPYGCENVVNGLMGQDGGADWSTHGEGAGAWIQLDLNEKMTVTQLKFAGRVRDDKFKKVCVSFSDGSSQKLEFPDNTYLNSFDLSPVNTIFVRITCLTCYNILHVNRGAQAIELWGTEEVINRHCRQTMSVPTAVVAVGETETIPVITFRLGSCHEDDEEDDNDLCVMIDGELNKNSMMEEVMQSQDVCNELGVGTPSEWKFMVKKKQSSFISLRWNEFRSIKVHQLTRIENVDENYLVLVKEKKSKRKVDEAKLEDLRKAVLTMSNILDDLTQSNCLIDKRLPFGNYFIKTTRHEPSGQVAGWGLSAGQLHGGKRNGGSSWVATDQDDQWDCKWSVTPGKTPNTYRIKIHAHAASGQPAGWGLSAWQLHGGQRNCCSSRVAVHDGEHWPMDWEIVPGKKTNTWRILTTHHAAGGQPAGWGLSSWGHKVEDTMRNGASSWVHVHQGDHWPMDWIFEQVS